MKTIGLADASSSSTKTQDAFGAEGGDWMRSLSPCPKRTIYVAPLVHSLSLNTLECSDLSYICVSSEGIIEWVEHVGTDTMNLDQVLEKYDLSKRDIVIERMEEGFICPGLVDTHTVCPVL